MRNSLGGLVNRMEMTQAKVSECEDQLTEITQSEKQREKTGGKKKDE